MDCRLHQVYLKRAHQLLGTYDALCRYRDDNRAHYGPRPGQRAWEAHHLFEDRELDNLGVRMKFPPRGACLCVLIPDLAHKRLNSIFAAHTRSFRDVAGVLEGYRLAHSMLGDYTGAPPRAVATELDRLVLAAFRLAGLTSSNSGSR